MLHIAWLWLTYGLITYTNLTELVTMIDNRTPARRHLDVQVIIQDDAKSRHALGQHPRRHNDQGQPNQFHWRESVRHSWCMDQLPANTKKKANQLSQANPKQYRWQISPPNFNIASEQNDGWKTTFLLGRELFSDYVNLREGNPTYFFNNGQSVLSDLDWHLLTLFAGETFQFQAKKTVSSEDWAPKKPSKFVLFKLEESFQQQVEFARYNIKILYIGINVND